MERISLRSEKGAKRYVGAVVCSRHQHGMSRCETLRGQHEASGVAGCDIDFLDDAGWIRVAGFVQLLG
jgi:hypothetical protein